MKQFSEMNEAEQKAWWLELAKQALEAMKMPNATVEWLSYTHNAVFAVNNDNQASILRISLRNKEFGNKLSLVGGEYNVLDVLEQKAIPAPVILAYQAEEDYIAVLFKKAEGVEKTALEIDATDIQNIGAYLAKLHRCDFPNIPNWLSLGIRPSLDDSGLFSNSGLYPLNKESKALFSEKQLNIMDTVALTVKSAMDELGQGTEEFGLIHGDLLLKNILFHGEEVRALDFEYCGFGYYLYDLCPLLWQLKPLPNYKELEEALWNGYSSIRPLTERHRQLLETFIAGRQVASLRWVAANQHNPAYQGKVTSILQQRTAELQGFLETGILKRN